MKTKKNILLISFPLFFFITLVNGQSNEINAFENLVGGKWVSEGKQLGGQDGKTIHEFEWGLSGKIVKTKLHNTDPKTLEFGLRNEGIRAYNAADSVIQFYEFDKFGGITLGKVLIEGKDMHYEYEYHGLKLRDSWNFIDPNKYELIVGVWLNGEWEKKYHEAIFIRKR